MTEFVQKSQRIDVFGQPAYDENFRDMVLVEFVPNGYKAKRWFMLTPAEADQLAYALQSASSGSACHIIVENGTRRYGP